eukprot:SAG11_NODE_2937_length_2824_cov_1.679633_4_plen_46_part_01
MQFNRRLLSSSVGRAADAAAFMFRTVNALRSHNISALSWWTFSSIF